MGSCSCSSFLFPSIRISNGILQLQNIRFTAQQCCFAVHYYNNPKICVLFVLPFVYFHSSLSFSLPLWWSCVQIPEYDCRNIIHGYFLFHFRSIISLDNDSLFSLTYKYYIRINLLSIVPSACTSVRLMYIEKKHFLFTDRLELLSFYPKISLLRRHELVIGCLPLVCFD